MNVTKAALFGALLLAVAACDSSEERAEKHYQSGLEFLESGDVDRALVELRNVFALNATHKDARKMYARAVRDRGNISEAFASYTRVIDIDPNDTEARLALTEMAILAQNWDEAERHGLVLASSEGDIDGKDVAELALAFRAAAVEEDMPAIRDLTRQAEAMLENDPTNQILIRLLLEGYSRDGRMDEALELSSKAIEAYPRQRAYYIIKGSMLQQRQDIDGLESHLRAMIAQFPEDNDIKADLLRLLVGTGKAETAQQFLRDEIAAGANEAEKIERHVSLIAFIRQSEGEDAALTEIDSAMRAYEDKKLLRALQASILFDKGDSEQGVALMQALVDEQGEDADAEETNRYKVTLARMLVQVGNEVGARQLVEEVLANDSSQVEALKMSAEWLINADRMDEAIGQLRTALDQAPEDASAMTLMAQAHQRNGNPELAQDLLSLAVEASNNAPAESMRFASLLIQQENFRSAEDVVINALRTSPGDTRLLRMLGNIYLQTEDWSRATQVETTLRRDDENPAAIRIADDLRLQILTRRDGRDRAMAFLEQLAGEEDTATGAKIALIRASLTEGNGENALALAQELVDENPESAGAAMVLGNTYMALQQFDDAETIFRKITDSTPENSAAWIQLVRVMSAKGQRDNASGVVDRALVANPGDPNLMWAKATFLEQSNDVDGAIAIYEELYAANNNSLVVANNLASLLATYKQDDASLERAYQVARRLRGTEVAPFQDTYGWIAHRRGETEEAITYLEPAAEALRNDPIVQYHLGTAYLALERRQDALIAFQRAIDVADETDERPQIVESRQKIQELSE